MRRLAAGAANDAAGPDIDAGQQGIVYVMEKATKNGGLVLAEGQFTIRYRGRSGSYLCRVTLDLTREYPVLIDSLESVHALGPAVSMTDSVVLEVNPDSKPVECYIIGPRSNSSGAGQTTSLTLLPRGDAPIERGAPLVRLNSDIVNLHQYRFGPPYNSRFTLEDDSWVYEFTPVSESTFLYPPRIQNESYSFSHHLTLRKRDGLEFSPAEAQKALQPLGTFLSFCAEYWVVPALVAGLDSSGQVAMENWGTPRLAIGHTPRNWMDENHGRAMVDVFPGFSRLMQDTDWRDALRTAVYWYVRSDTNNVGPDGSIILLQAALERLAWHLLVRRRHAISQRAFSKLPGSDQLRLLLDLSSIPLELPSILTDLTATASLQHWVDGPEAFVSLRNGIVHPRRTWEALDGRVYYEALQLGKWYLELVLLKACGYHGLYANRLRIPRYAGQVEAVPWAHS